MSFRYFKTNVTDGFRLVDLEKDLKQGQYFYIENNIVRISKCIQSALKHNCDEQYSGYGAEDDDFYMRAKRTTNVLLPSLYYNFFAAHLWHE